VSMLPTSYDKETNHITKVIFHLTYQSTIALNKSTAQVFPSSRLLRVKAVVCCQIVEIAVAWKYLDVIESWCRIIQMEYWPYKSSSRTEILWRTLITDQYGHRNPAPSDAQNSFCQFIRNVIAAKSIIAERHSLRPSYIFYNTLAQEEGILPSRDTIDIVKQSLQESLLSSSTSGYNDQPGAKFVLDLDTRTTNAELLRCEYHTEFNRAGNNLCVTDEGYMGLVPDEAKPGDFICFIQGTRVPFVLRRSPGGRYRLISECYLHGYMRGELAGLGLLVEDLHLE
jgi:hypothetical protein